MTKVRPESVVTSKPTPACGGFPEVPGRAMTIVGSAKDLPTGWYTVEVDHPALGRGRLCVHESTFAEA